MSKISVSTFVNGSMDKVWEYWTQPKHIVNWNFATDEWCCPAAKNELKPGATFSWRMEAKNGKMGFDFEGTYSEIIENKRIAYSMADGRNVTIDFTREAGGVKILETFDAEGSNGDEQQQAGWQAILENFKRYAESI